MHPFVKHINMKKYLNKPQNAAIIRENAVAGIIVLLLMGFVGPFNVNELDNTRFLYFILMALTIFVIGCLAGFFTCYVLKMPLDPSLPLRTIHRNTLMLYLVNLPLTAAGITTIFGAMYCDHLSDIWWYDGHINLIPYFHFLYYVVSLGAFICFGTLVRNRNWHLHYELEEMKAINALLEERHSTEEEKRDSPHAASCHTRMASKEKEKETAPIVTEEATTASVNEPECICRFEGNTMSSTLEVQPSQILYVESMANYADIWYLDNDMPTHKLLRITLKQVKSLLESIPFLVQCHRAFIVNLHFVVTMTNRSNSYQLELFGTDKQIPVSRSYTSGIKERLQECKGLLA